MDLSYSSFYTCNTLSHVFQCALILEPVIYSKGNNILKTMYKIGKIKVCNKKSNSNMDGMVINEHMNTTDY